MELGFISEAIVLKKIIEIGKDWLMRRDDEQEFLIPDTNKDNDRVPPAVIRHLHVIKDAMATNDYATVGNRQRRLAKLGIEVPTKPSHVEDMLRKYSDATQINR